MAESDNGAATADNQGDDNAQQFGVQKFYLKDTSLEAPAAPEVFRAEWRPEANVELSTKHNDLGDGVYEVIVQITVTAKLGEQTAYLCEIQQAGVFTLGGFDEATLEGLLGVYCPSMLFPYAREVISDLTGKAGFPPMVLSPVNFDALYAQKRARQQEAGHA